MDEQQKRAYCILNTELSTYDDIISKNWMNSLIQGCISALRGERRYHADSYPSEKAFKREVNKIMYLTDISVDDMIVVLIRLMELWQ